MRRRRSSAVTVAHYYCRRVCMLGGDAQVLACLLVEHRRVVYMLLRSKQGFIPSRALMVLVGLRHMPPKNRDSWGQDLQT